MKTTLVRKDKVEINGKLCGEKCPQLEYVDCDGPGAPDDYYKCRLFDKYLGPITPTHRAKIKRCEECRKAVP